MKRCNFALVLSVSAVSLAAATLAAPAFSQRTLAGNQKSAAQRRQRAMLHGQVCAHFAKTSKVVARLSVGGEVGRPGHEMTDATQQWPDEDQRPTTREYSIRSILPAAWRGPTTIRCSPRASPLTRSRSASATKAVAGPSGAFRRRPDFRPDAGRRYWYSIGIVVSIGSRTSSTTNATRSSITRSSLLARTGSGMPTFLQ